MNSTLRRALPTALRAARVPANLRYNAPLRHNSTAASQAFAPKQSTWSSAKAAAAAATTAAATLAFVATRSPSEASAVALVRPSPVKPPFKEQFPNVYEQLVEIVGEDNISLDADELEQRGKEESGYAAPSNPQAVVSPENTEQVSQILRVANKNRIPVVPYAAGSSVEGHTIALQGGICLTMDNMDEVLTVNVEDMDCVVQPGLGWKALNEHCAEYKMFLGVDPAPTAFIGGMCGTCCSGTNAVRYGTMKDQVVNLTVVLADGTVVKTGQRARKSSAGYDLARLFVGSEGTLGIVTEATLKLRNVPDQMSMARVTFPSVHAACSAVIEILQKGVQMGAIEIMDEEMVKAVNKDCGMQLPLKPTILFKFTGSAAHVKDDIRVVKEITNKHTQEGYHFAQTEEESNQLWEARKGAFWSALHMVEGKEMMATDVAVPISKLADCIMETKKELDASFLFCPIVGHVGDGNFHVVIVFDPNDPKEDEEAHRLNNLMVKRAIKMGGTCTGEHGVGIGKKGYLPLELGEEAVELMRTLKRALDPNNILNPGKIFDM